MTLKLVLNRQEIIDCVRDHFCNQMLPEIHGRHYEADSTGHYGLYEITIVSVVDPPIVSVVDPPTDEPAPSSDEVSEERV